MDYGVAVALGLGVGVPEVDNTLSVPNGVPD